MPEHAPHDPSDTAQAAEDFWNSRYGERDQIWSGNPNPVLVREASDLNAGHALDLGCGEGADALWLAARGWTVVAVDVSTTALSRGRMQARSLGLDDQVEWRQVDLMRSFPAGSFDLVSAQFLQSPIELDRTRILRAAAASVAPGGSLLVVGHAEMPPWSGAAHVHEHLPSADEVLASLALPADAWQTIIVRNEDRAGTSPEGVPVTLVDSVVLVRRT